jgi:hypothetical protein
MEIEPNKIRTYITKLRRNKVLRQRILQHLAIAIHKHRLAPLVLDSTNTLETLYVETEKLGAFEAEALSKLELAFRKPLRSGVLWTEAAVWFLTQHQNWQNTQDFQAKVLIPKALAIVPDAKRPGEESWIEAQLLSQLACQMAHQLLEQQDWPVPSVEDLEVLLGGNPPSQPVQPEPAKIQEIEEEAGALARLTNPIARSLNYPSSADQEFSPWKKVGGDCFLEFIMSGNSVDVYAIENAFAQIAWEILQRLGAETTYLFLTLVSLASEATTPWKGGFQVKAAELIRRINWDNDTNLDREKRLKRIQSLVQWIVDLSISIIHHDSGKKGYVISNSKLFILEEFQFLGSVKKIHLEENIYLDSQPDKLTEAPNFPEDLIFRIRPGYWIRPFINKTGATDTEALRRYIYLAKSTLTINYSTHPLAAKLSIFMTLMNQIQTNGRYQIASVLMVLESKNLINSIQKDSELCDRLLEAWDSALLTLARLGWEIKFDPKTYPRSLQPSWSQTEGSPTYVQVRPKNWLSLWLNAQLTITPTTLIQHRLEISKTLFDTRQEGESTSINNQHQGSIPKTIPGYALEMALAAKGLAKAELAKQMQIDRSLVTHWIKGSRAIQPNHCQQLWQLLGKELQQVTGIRG